MEIFRTLCYDDSQTPREVTASYYDTINKMIDSTNVSLTG